MSFAKRSSKKYGGKPYTFVMLRHDIIDSQNFRNLSHKAIKLLIDLWRQFNGFNNGDFTAAWSVMKKRGWKSRETLYRALRELRYYEFIELTRQGGKNRCSLYAVTCESINECKGKLDVPTTRVASNGWKEPKPKYSHPRALDTR